MKNNRLKDNDFLTNLNMDNATDRQKIALLNRIIDNELEKPESEVDMTLVDECMAFIADLEGNKFQKTDDELTANLQKIMFGESRKGSATQIPPNSKGFKQYAKSFSILIAATLALVALLAVAASFFPTESTSAPTTTAAPQMIHPQDVVICIDGIETAAYSSVDALLKGENLNVSYPSKFPTDIRLERVDLWRHENNQVDLTLHFNTTDLQFQVCSNELFSDSSEGKQELTHFTVAEFMFTLYRLENGTYEATCTVGEYAYRITCINYADLILMLNHMTES